MHLLNFSPGLVAALRRIGFALFLLLALRGATAQTIPFTSGPIPLCATSTFTADVSGVGTLYPAGYDWWSPYLAQLEINITSDHPQTLQIQLTSPQGTTLLLAEYLGAGGQNYTNTVFGYFAWTPITTGTAPFTGTWMAQGGGLNAFDYENANGTWTITVTDTSCVNGGAGEGGTWTPGWFDGGGSGGFSFGFNTPPPCWGGIPDGSGYACDGAPVDILGYYTSTAPYNYYVSLNWSPVVDPSNVTEPGTYSIEAYDPWDGCVYMASFTVYAVTGSDLGDDVVLERCPDDPPENLMALFPSATAQIWTFNGGTLSDPEAQSASAPGVYQMITANGGLCNDTVLVTLTLGSAPDLGADGTMTTCAGAPADLTTTFNTAGLTTAWSFAGAPCAAPTAATVAGVYTLTATNAGGCSDVAEVTLVVELNLELGADQSIVMCSNTTADVTALYSTAGFATTWTLQGVTVPDPAAIADGGLYRLVVSSGANCSDTAWVNVDEQPAPAIGDDATATICPGGTADLTASLALAGCTTQWSLAGAPVPDATALSTPGVYTVIATATNGCSDVADVSLIVAAEPVLGADQSITACDNVTTDLTALFNTIGYTTSWTLNGAAVPEPTATITAGTYALSATNASGCSNTVSVQLQTIAAPVLSADQTLNTCADAPVDLTALYTTNGLPSLWTLNGSPVVDATAANATGLYRLVVSSTSGCSDTALVDLLVSPVPDLGADLSLERCPWQTVDLSALFPVAGLTVSYTLNGVPVLDPTAVADTGTFVVTVGDDIGCSDYAQVHVSEQYCACMADFGTDLHCLQEPARFEVLADSVLLSAYWDFHGAATNSHLVDPSVRFATDAPVRVTLDATLTCGTVRVERILEPVDCSAQCSLWVPAAFTPDDDGLNDAWRWSSACAVSDFSVVVFDRWGERVFASTDPSELWDGTFQGATIPTGVYAYRMSYRLPYQERADVSGSVTLVR